MKHQILIIGSGLGGLLTAVLLAKEGYDVAVIEQDKQIGGCLQTFAFDKKVFDSAVHYIGSLDEGEVLHEIFAYAGIMQDLKLQRLDANCFDALIFDENTTTFSLAQGSENFRKSLSATFPDEVKAVDKYMNFLLETCAAVPLYNLRMGDESEKQPYLNLTLSDVLTAIGASELLQNVLAGNAILYAGKANSTPWLTHALVMKSYIDSAWRCVGGSSQIAKLLWKQLQHFGGKIYKHEKVERLETKDGLVIAAHTTSGKSFSADAFISNIHPKQTLAILDDASLLKKVYKDRIHKAQESIGCLMLNIILEPKIVAYENFNINWNAGNPLNTIAQLEQDFPANYSIYYTEDQQYKGYAESVSILTYVDVKEWAAWENSYNNTLNASLRSDAYQAYKAAKADVLLAKIAERFPELKQYKKSCKIATPLTYRDYQGSGIGSLYGIRKDVEHAAATNFSTKTRIENLHLTGQNVNLHGVLGVAMTAIQTASSFIGMEKLLNKIKEKHI